MARSSRSFEVEQRESGFFCMVFLVEARKETSSLVFRIFNNVQRGDDDEERSRGKHRKYLYPPRVH